LFTDPSDLEFPAMKAVRLCAVAGAAAVAVLGLSGPALAHCTVSPEGQAPKGGYAVLDFKVPNERDNASTTKVEVVFPVDRYPLTSVAPQPVPGWTIKITRTRLSKPLTSGDGTVKEAVSRITWTADGKGIEPGFFQKFAVSVGKLPETTDEMTFKALQTYSDHEVVRWIEPRQEGQPEPDNPAPVLHLSPAADAADQHGEHDQDGQGGTQAGDASAAAGSQENAVDTGDSGGGTDTTARVLGVLGIVTGVLGVAYGVLAGRRRSTD
jgi:uncharacterized protein